MSQSFDLASKQIILKEFDKNGFLLRPACLTKLIEKYSSQEFHFTNPEGLRAHIKLIIEQIKNIYLHNFHLESNVLDENILDEALKMLHLSNSNNQYSITTEIPLKNQSDSKLQQLLQQKIKRSLILLNAFTEFPQNNQNSQGLLGAADDKINMQIDRFSLIREKMNKNPNYIFDSKLHITPIVLNQIPNQPIEICEIGSLVGSHGQKFILGVLIELELQTLYLQDVYSKVKLDLSKAEPSHGFISTGNVYVVAGEYMNEVFSVKRFLLPEYESRKRTLKNYGSFDFFGTEKKIFGLYGKIMNLELENKILQENTDVLDKRIKKLKELNTTQQVFLGCLDLTTLSNSNPDDAMLNKSSVAVFSNFLLVSDSLNKFEIALKGFETLQPLVFVLMGEFSNFSEINDKKEFNEYNQNLEIFLNIVKKFPKYCQSSSWLFIPGTQDIGLQILPREGLPNFIFEKIRKVLPLAYNCTNPCRVSILGKEFVFSRNDLIKDLRRSSVIKCDENIELEKHFGDTVLSQFHLCPINCYAQPIYWKYDFCLRIHKLPNFLVLGDSFCRQFERKLGDDEEDASFIINPGNFAKTTCFVLIYPILNNVQICKINK